MRKRRLGAAVVEAASKRGPEQIYCTSYCNQGHKVRTGYPVGHECRVIPPKALQAEMAGDFQTAIKILNKP